MPRIPIEFQIQNGIPISPKQKPGPESIDDEASLNVLFQLTLGGMSNSDALDRVVSQAELEVDKSEVPCGHLQLRHRRQLQSPNRTGVIGATDQQ